MCFSVTAILLLLVWIVVICAVVAILRLLLPYVLSWLGVSGDLVMRVINILIAAIVIIAIIYLVIDVLSCLGGGIRPLR
jgi:hypothetical protein